MPQRAEACFLSPEDAARIYKKPAKVSAIEKVYAGTANNPIEITGLQLAGVSRDEIKRGDVIVGKPRRSTDG
jgi:hypothetical protein